MNTAKTVEHLRIQAQQAAREARHQLADGRSMKHIQQTQDQLLGALREQHEELRLLRKDLSRSRKSSGGFPWGLVLLAGAAYALYRTNPGVKDTIDGVLKRADPGLGGNLARAGDAVQGAVDDLKQGHNPADNFGKVVGETQRAGEKVAGKAQDTATDVADNVKNLARQAADDVKTGSSVQGKGQA